MAFGHPSSFDIEQELALELTNYASEKSSLTYCPCLVAIRNMFIPVKQNYSLLEHKDPLKLQVPCQKHKTKVY